MDDVRKESIGGESSQKAGNWWDNGAFMIFLILILLLLSDK